jgi:hypothetical protein
VAKGLYVMPDDRALVDYGARQAVNSHAQYRANGYKAQFDKLSAAPGPEGPRSPRAGSQKRIRRPTAP